MPNQLPLPDDIQHLVEKRENSDRRQEERKSDPQEAATSDEGQTKSEQFGDAAEPDEERRSGQDRRQP